MKDDIHKAEPHVIAAIRRLEMMLWFLRNGKRLNAQKHVEPYFDLITNDLAAIQREVCTDDEYTQRLASGLAYVSRDREYKYNVTSNDSGEVFYDLDVVLPLSEMKGNVIFARRAV
jgi:hypothetical protein